MQVALNFLNKGTIPSGFYRYCWEFIRDISLLFVQTSIYYPIFNRPSKHSTPCGYEKYKSAIHCGCKCCNNGSDPSIPVYRPDPSDKKYRIQEYTSQ